MPLIPTAFHSSPMTRAKSSMTDMSPPRPRAAAARPASLGKAVNAPEVSLMPARACGSMWLRAFDFASTGIPRRLPSARSWSVFMKVAICEGVTLEPARKPVSGPHVVRPGDSTTLRTMIRRICWVPR